MLKKETYKQANKLTVSIKLYFESFVPGVLKTCSVKKYGFCGSGCCIYKMLEESSKIGFAFFMLFPQEMC